MRSAAVVAGLRTLVVRKGVGRVEVIVDRSVPVRLHVVAAGGTIAVDDLGTGAYTSFRTVHSHSMFLAAEGRNTTPPLDLRVEVGFGSVLVEHGRPAAAAVQSQVAALRSFRAQVVADIAARTALLRTDRRTLQRLTAAYTARLRVLRRGPVAAGRASLRLPESFWQAVGPASAQLAAVDPALRRIERLGAAAVQPAAGRVAHARRRPRPARPAGAARGPRPRHRGGEGEGEGREQAMTAGDTTERLENPHRPAERPPLLNRTRFAPARSGPG